jgi:hypothetical protein
MIRSLLVRFALHQVMDAAWGAAWRCLPLLVAVWLAFSFLREARLLPGSGAWIFPVLWYGIAAAGLAWFLWRSKAVFSTGRLRRECDAAFPQSRGLFSIVWELGAESGAASPELAKRARQEAEQYLAGRQYVFPRKPPHFRRGGGLLLAGLTAAGLALVMNPEVYGRGLLDLAAARTAGAAERYVFRVFPGSAEIERGTGLTFQLGLEPDISGLPVQFFWRSGNGPWNSRTPRYQAGRYQAQLEQITDPLEYYFRAGLRESDRYPVAVFRFPRVDFFQVRVTPPAYTGLPAFALPENQGDVVSLAGSQVCFKLKANGPVDSVWLVRGGNTRPYPAEGNRSSGCFTLNRSEDYFFRLQDPAGRSNRDQVKFTLKAVADEAPLVKFVAPGEHTLLTPSLVLALKLEALDDFGFTRAQLLYRINREGVFQDSGVSSIPLPESRPLPLTFAYIWSLAGLGLLPDDEVFYRVRIWDNNTFNGPHWGETATQTARFPSLEQIHAQLQAEEESQTEDLQTIRREQDKLMGDAEKFKRQLQAQEKWTPKEREHWEKLQDRQKELAEKIEKNIQKLGENVQKSSEYKLFDRDLAEKMQQVQELFRQVIPPEMLQSLQKETPDPRSVDLKKVQEAMEHMMKNQEELKRGLERTIAQLKRLKLEQNLTALTKRLEDLAGQHQNLAPQFSDTARRPEAARQEKNLAEKTGNVGKELEKAAPAEEKSLAEFKRALDSLGKEVRKLGEKMAQHAEQSATQSPGQSQARQQQMQQQFADLLKQLQKMRESLNQQQDQQSMAELTALIQSLLELSRSQEELRQELAQPALPESLTRFTEEELGIERGAQRMAADWLGRGDKSISLPKNAVEPLQGALNSVRRGVDYLSQRNPGSAGRSMEEAMGGFNRAALALLAMRGAAKAGSGMSLSQLMQRMQGMSAEQQLINQLTMQLLQGLGQCPMPGGPGSGGKEEMALRAGMDRLRQGQQQLAGEMDQLSQAWAEKSGQKSGGAGLKEIQEEMKKVAEDMGNRKVDQKTVERQEKILSRMLDYSQSIRERKFSPRRESQTAKNYRSRDPGEIAQQMEARRRKLQEDMFRALQQDYAREYRPLIKAYFEQLQEKTLGE